MVDGFSALVNAALPKDNTPAAMAATASDSRGRKGKNAKGPSKASLRRTQTLQFVTSALQRLAAACECAVVVLGQCATRMQWSVTEGGATLVPAVGATVWEQGVATRVVLFRDWAWVRDEAGGGGGGIVGLRFAGVQKLNGKECPHLGSVAAFSIEEVSC
jgi:hypothetical protein